MIDAHPFHVLLPRQRPSLRLRALKLTGNEHRSEDLVQETLLKAWAKRDSYRAETNLGAWLFTIMRNTFVSDWRKLRREVQDVDGDHALAQLTEPNQLHALALAELLAAIALLPQTQRRPLVLMGAYGLSLLETAEACGCAVGTVKSRVSRGRAALSQTLAHDVDARTDQPSRARFHAPAHRPPAEGAGPDGPRPAPLALGVGA